MMVRLSLQILYLITLLSQAEGFTNLVNGSHFDYVILGGGTAGMVVAGRLSENPNITVAVIEAGKGEETNPNVTNPAGLGLGKNTRIDWQYQSVPQIFSGNQTLIWSAGKGLGGSSLINGKGMRDDVRIASC
jgi:choline dehydrogenase-like flavoprotein